MRSTISTVSRRGQPIAMPDKKDSITQTGTSNTTGTTTGNSTQVDNGTITTNTMVPLWAQQGNQQQYNLANQGNDAARQFYTSLLGGGDASANLWANREFAKMLQQATGAPGFTEQGAASQGIASAEAMAAVQAAMMDRMFQASEGIQQVGQNTVPFLNLAGQWAPKQEVRNLTTTKNFTENNNSNTNTTNTTGPMTGGGGTRSTVTRAGGSPTAQPYQGYLGSLTGGGMLTPTGVGTHFTPGDEYAAWARMNGFKPVRG